MDKSKKVIIFIYNLKLYKNGMLRNIPFLYALNF